MSEDPSEEIHEWWAVIIWFFFGCVFAYGGVFDGIVMRDLAVNYHGLGFHVTGAGAVATGFLFVLISLFCFWWSWRQLHGDY